ncbi:hypothetical protein PsYK624_134300 [Phanerochaete sordida]|uniref:Uncharacterized protein n=1 Tax=Phanerochaete sordida TaxID=48140 RepID=A0A9P3GKZ6_9APHY|nr:hypothetical protein PsYK624_134300 [Phanerochaete sordida]
MHTKIGAAAEGGVGGIAGASAGVLSTSSVLGPELERHGRLFPDSALDAGNMEELKKDQAVFLKRFRVMRRWPFIRKSGKRPRIGCERVTALPQAGG